MRLKLMVCSLLIALMVSGCAQDSVLPPEVAAEGGAPAVEGTVAAEPPESSTPANDKGAAPAQPPVQVVPPPPAAPKPEQEQAVTPQPPGGVVQFQAIDGKLLPKDLQGWAASAGSEAGAAVQVVDGVLYVKVEAGQQNTGGYRVEIRQVELAGDQVKVQAVLHRPAPGAMVTQALTYPKAFAKVNYQGAGALQVQVEWVK